jgi:hypothetical protein
MDKFITITIRDLPEYLEYQVQMAIDNLDTFLRDKGAEVTITSQKLEAENERQTEDA